MLWRSATKRIGQNRVAAGKPRDSHNPGQIYCEESFGEDEATEKTPWNKARAGASKPGLRLALREMTARY